MKWILKILLALFLTVLTQVGGLIYLLNEVFWIKKGNALPFYKRRVKILSFMLVYSIATFVVIPHLTKIGGRKALPVFETDGLHPLNLLICILNRHYVKNEMYDVVMKASIELNEVEGVLNYLDANFPFVSGFPLFPHLSHNDGKKLDLAFCYRNKKDQSLSNSAPSFIGYGVSEEPNSGEGNTAEFCSERGYWHYGLLNKLIYQRNKEDFVFDELRTKRLLNILLADNHIGKIFIEPHLIKRMSLNNNKIRFHGCHAVRHDDHIHIQLK